MNTATPSPRFNDIIVVVHGIGDQSRYSTVRSVATRFANSKALLSCSKQRPVAPQPLGYFHSEVRSITAVRLDDAASLSGTDLDSIGFTEVYWADIPRKAVDDAHTLEETKAWAHTVIARAKGLYDRANRDPKHNKIVPPDFPLAGEVLEEIIETVYVLENLAFLAQKAGILKFDLRKVLEDYLDDVQLVAEFSDYSADIVRRFQDAMESVHGEQVKSGNPDVRLHIVAHSEGTVVSFLGMLHAMSKDSQSPADTTKQSEVKMDEQGFPKWLRQVRGYMTIGSPIDKHLLLWPRLWVHLEPKRCHPHIPARQIRWRNYYDYGDPVGFKLDSARLWLQQKRCNAFQFRDCDDIGFARYLLPGEAHNEYWNDPEVFEHFIAEAIKRGLFSVGDLRNPSSFAAKLKQPVDAVSTYVCDRLSVATRQALVESPGSGSVSEPLQKILVQDLNTIIQGKLIYDPVRFAGVTLRRQTKQLLVHKPHDEDHEQDLVRLNRSLLEDAYPRDLSRNPHLGDKWLVALLSPALPYVFSFLMLAIGTFVLYKALHTYTDPTSDSLQRFVRFKELGVNPAPDPSGWEVFCAITGITALMAGTTLLARFPRLALGARWKIWGVVAFLAGCVLYIDLASSEIRNEIGGKFWYLSKYLGDMAETLGVIRGDLAKTLGVLAVAAVAGMSGNLVMARRIGNPDRRKRWLLKGMRPLILCGAVALAFLVTLQMLPRGFSRHLDDQTSAGKKYTLTEEEFRLAKQARLSKDELQQIMNAQGKNWVTLLKQVQPILATHPPAWPVVLAEALFLYLWWLATLLFDLAFVWHRSIRRSTTNTRLQEWNALDCASRGQGKETESCSSEKDVAG